MTTVNKLMIGVAAGAILGILYAPDKGSITRRKLNRTGNNLRNKINDFRDAINDKIENLNEDLDDYAYQETVVVENEAAEKPHSWQ